MKKMIALLLCLVMILGVMTGCGGGSGSEETAGELNLFTWDGMFPQEVLDAFEDETGIRIYYSNFDTDEAMLAKLEETQGGDYDLVIADDYIIEVAIAEGLVQKLDKAKISTYDNLNPLYMGQFYDPADEYTIPWGAGIPLIVYNPTLTGFHLTGYGDLWNPVLKDNVALIGNYRVINGITLKTMGESMNVDDVAKIEAAGEKLKELAPNVRVISDSNTQDFLISEEVGAALLYTSQVNLAMTSSDNLAICYPKEGLGFGIMAAFIPSQAPNSDAAHLFLEYLNQPEVAAKCFEYLGYYCTNKAAEDYISEAMYDLLVVPETVTEGEIIQNISQEGEDAHAKAWNEFKAACGQ